MLKQFSASLPHGGAPAGATMPCLPVRAGIGLKPEHFHAVLEMQPDVGFFEIHAENYMVDGGPLHHYLTRIREQYPLSLHGVGLSIGGESALDTRHLDKLAALIRRYAPQSFSEHLAWSSHGDVFLNDLLPVSYDATSLQRVCDHIDQVQSHLQCRMLLENPASYVEFSSSTMTEAEFIREVVQRTGCGLLLDVNNVYISSVNHQRDACAMIRALSLLPVGEVHLAGFAQETDAAGAPLLIDSHGAAVAQEVWGLYQYALERLGPVATLIEWDNDVPALEVLCQEAMQADCLLQDVAVWERIA